MQMTKRVNDSTMEAYLTLQGSEVSVNDTLYECFALPETATEETGSETVVQGIIL
jgi:hypothetical protein